MDSIEQKNTNNKQEPPVNNQIALTDEQHVFIAKQQYNKKLNVGDPLIISAEDTMNILDTDITVGYVAEIIHAPTGADVFVVTDIKLPENPTDADRAKVTRVTMLYQGSQQLLEDWLLTNPDLGVNSATAGVLLHEIPTGSVEAHTVILPDKTSSEGIIITEDNKPKRSTGNAKTFPPTVKSALPQFDAASKILNNTMEKFPNAMFDLYSHSLGSSECQYSLGMCKYIERINSAWLYNGPNAYYLLPWHGRKNVDLLRPRIHVLYDPNDPVGLAYWLNSTVGLLSKVKTKNIGNNLDSKKKQHNWGGYIFDNFGRLIDKYGNIVITNTGVSELDINGDGLSDIFFNSNTNQYLFTDYSNLSNPKSIHFNLDFQHSYLPLGQKRIDIQLHPELLHSLVSDTIANIETLLEVVSAICALCIESNSEIGEKKEDREKTVYESIQEVFRGCNIPLIFENLNASIGKFKDCSDIFNTLSSPGTLRSPKLENNECIERIGSRDMSISDYNTELTQLANAAILVADICSKEQCDDPSLIFPEH